MTKYDDYVILLENQGYVPNGRYEHIHKRCAAPVHIVWYHIQSGETIILVVSTDSYGCLDKVISTYKEV